MCNITNHWRNGNQSYSEIVHPTPVRMAIIKTNKQTNKKKPQITNVGQNVEKREPVSIVDGNVI